MNGINMNDVMLKIDSILHTLHSQNRLILNMIFADLNVLPLCLSNIVIEYVLPNHICKSTCRNIDLL